MEEKTTRGSGHDRDQEVEQVVRVAALREMVGELAVDGSKRKRRRKSAEKRDRASNDGSLWSERGCVGFPWWSWWLKI